MYAFFSLAGRYSCIIQRTSLPYIQWQDIILEPRPNILLNMTDTKFQCTSQMIRMSCCEDHYEVMWDNGTDTSKGCTYRYLYCNIILQKLQNAVISSTKKKKKNRECF